MKATIRLFKALPITTKNTKEASKKLLQESTKRGFVFTPEVIANYTEKELLTLVKVIEKEVGLTAEKMNNTFQKSWKKVKETKIEQLLMEQLVHYFTTYGFKSLGIFDPNSVYVPRAKLDIPGLEEDVKLVVIKGYTKEELKIKLLDLLGSGIAFSEDTLNDLMDVSYFVEFTPEEIAAVKNYEAKAILYDCFTIVPEDPIEFLRLAIYKLVNETLIIKNDKLINAIKETIPKRVDVAFLFKDYKESHGLERLAEIFYRFKPIFLAFKTSDNIKPMINRIRKLAKKHHKPMKEDYLNNITKKIKHGETIDNKKLKEELAKVNTFRKIRLAQALKYRTVKNTKSILYKIRNGKSFATEFNFEKKEIAADILKVVLESLVESISKNVKGKKIFSPPRINYALPATEKQFTGNLPSGTSITAKSDLIFGIHWENVGNRSIDLDLSMINATNLKLGWNGLFRNEERSVLFSGDMTDATVLNEESLKKEGIIDLSLEEEHTDDWELHGATELFYIKHQEETNFILFLNYYNFSPDLTIPYKIIAAKEQTDDFKLNYMINPNNILCISKSKVEVKQRVIGLVVCTPHGSTFYFNESNLGRSAVSSATKDYAQHARKYLFDFSTNSISLTEVFKQAGAIYVEKQEEAEIDLSPENLEKDTIINLLM